MPDRIRVTLAFAALAALLLLGAGVAWMGTGRPDIAGWLLTAMFACVAIACQGNPALKSYAYTMGILTVVTVALTMPGPFRKWGDFDLQGLIVPMMQVIMFGMGAQLSLGDFAFVVRRPQAVAVGLLCQFTIMPFLGFALAKGLPFPPEVAAGIILIGSAPSGLASNVMTFIARGNLALSVAITTCATLMAPVLTPALMKLLAGQFIPVAFWPMLLGIANMVLLPIIAGLLFNAFAYGTEKGKRLAIQCAAYVAIVFTKGAIYHLSTEVDHDVARRALALDVFWFLVLPVVAGLVLKRVLRGSRRGLDHALALVSMGGIAVVITVVTAAGRNNLLAVGPLLLLACLAHNTFGYVLGYWGGRLFGMNQTDSRTIAIEVGLQNGGLASGIALGMGKVATVGLAPAIFGPLMNITGSSLATRWRARPVTDGSAPPEHADPSP